MEYNDGQIVKSFIDLGVKMPSHNADLKYLYLITMNQNNVFIKSTCLKCVA